MIVSVETVGVMEGATFVQVAVVRMGSWFDRTLADSQQVIEDQVLIVNLQPQYVVLLGLEVGELLPPPGVGIVVTDGCHTQRGRGTERLDVAVCDSEEVRGKTTCPNVEHPELGFSHSQSAQEQQEERKTGGHGFTGSCGGGTTNPNCISILKCFLKMFHNLKFLS